jgi:hypothetical protein
MTTIIEKPLKKKKLTLKDLEIESFVTHDALRNMFLFTNDPNCAEVQNGIYAARTGNTQCKAYGGCLDVTNVTACITAAAGCTDATADTACYTVNGGCGDITVGCSGNC